MDKARIFISEDQWPRLVRALHEGMRRLGKAPGAQPQPPIAPSQQTTGQDLIPYALLLSQLADRLRGDDQSVQSPDIPPLHTFRFETVRMDARYFDDLVGFRVVVSARTV